MSDAERMAKRYADINTIGLPRWQQTRIWNKRAYWKRRAAGLGFERCGRQPSVDQLRRAGLL